MSSSSSDLTASVAARSPNVSTDPCDSLPYLYEDFTQLAQVRHVFIVLYVIVITVAFVGNLFVIWTVWRHKHMRTITNLYIVNLAVSDCLVTVVVMPLKLLEYTAPCKWRVFASDWVCALLYYTLPVIVFASVLTLVAISLERFYAVVYPLDAKTVMQSKSRTLGIIAATWTLSCIIATPYLYCKSYSFNIGSSMGRVSRQICTDRFDDIDVAMYGRAAEGSGWFRKGFFSFLFSVMYVLPSAIILFTCVRMAIRLLWPAEADIALRMRCTRPVGENKRKVARMVIFVSISFLTCWSPFYLVSLISQFQGKDNFLRRDNFLFTMLLTHFVGFLNSCINPLIYITMSDKFRRSFWMCLSMICRCSGFRKFADSRVNGHSRIVNMGIHSESREFSHSHPTNSRHLSSMKTYNKMEGAHLLNNVPGTRHQTNNVPGTRHQTISPSQQLPTENSAHQRDTSTNASDKPFWQYKSLEGQLESEALKSCISDMLSSRQTFSTRVDEFSLVPRLDTNPSGCSITTNCQYHSLSDDVQES